MISEPNLLIPKDVTIENIKEENTDQTVEVNATREELRNSFSLTRNEYLKCKWHQFLENVPNEVLIIKPFKEYKNKKYPIKRMILNGSFYLDSGKLIPAPNFKYR